MLWKKRHDKQQMRDASSEGCPVAKTVQYPSCCFVSIKVWVAPPCRENDGGVARGAYKSTEQEGAGWEGRPSLQLVLTNVVLNNIMLITSSRGLMNIQWV